MSPLLLVRNIGNAVSNLAVVFVLDLFVCAYIYLPGVSVGMMKEALVCVLHT